MSKGTKYILLLLIVAIIALAIYVGEQEKPKVGEGTKNENQATNTSANVATNNIENNTNKSIENNTVENNTVENTKIDTPENIIKSNTLSNEEKAKELAKQKWGGSDGVYFAIDTMNSDETYVVSVRDSATTKVLAWYTIDVKTGTVKD